ncbi:pyridoxamine 5'-phosphate oxidase (plasmid) [Paracoccus liaowanqingii]|uniref:Pyridoxamine 5'-phosphate oxidase n=1 Tax=Paracoccus liaowanqingii TaxID=2560053 RepID=A0A4Y5ST72_9RHOB|nr:pyridoxamine 5'-phosphate oxidase family protein [Paracoccus liaowanqingii]QDA36123.1 pyridoxamine 5'-phosphate oxidase [Paracoccus liaowanqingii]
MTTDPHPWAANLAELHDQAWLRLVRGVADRRAPARHPTLATVSPHGWPESRTVVLRAADPAAGVVEVHTDALSDKMAGLDMVPRAALHVWDASAHLQIRLQVQVAILTGAEAEATWNALPQQTRHSYGTRPAPGQPIPEALAYAKPADPSRFAILRCEVQRMDLLHLGPDHRRARFDREDGWAGCWLAP